MSQDKSVGCIGLDSHRRFSRVTARSSDGSRIVWRQRLEHSDRGALREVLRGWPRVPVILEATFGWGWICDELTAAGLEPHLAHSGKVAGWRKARGIAKSNRTDGDLLSELWFERQRWWEVWLAPPEVRDQRELLRWRTGLVAMQTRLKNQVHATLHRHGVIHPHSDLFGSRGRRWLSLVIADETEDRLSAQARRNLKGHLMLLDQVRRLIAQGTRQFRQRVRDSPAAARLKTLPGISWVLGYTILAEVGRIERFGSARHLCSYALLTPIAADSGEESDEAPLGRHVGRIGRRTLKWAMIEAAHGAVRGGGRFRALFDRRTNGGRRDRNRGYIAVAHELCRLVYVLWSKQMDYSPTPPRRPGDEQDKRNASRPGATQPEHPMAAAVSRRLQVSS